MRSVGVILLMVLGSACIPSEPEPNTDVVLEPADVQTARKELPSVLSLHKTVIARSCSPTGGVCHNAKEYPDLHTVGNLLAALRRPCNADKSEDPSMIFDGCEPEADALVLDGSTVRYSIAMFGVEEWDPQTRSLFRRFILDRPAERSSSKEPARITRGGETIIALPANLELTEGDRVAKLRDLFLVDYETLNRIKGGDPNRNGMLGAEDPWQLIMPGVPERSYLVGRLIGAVPGTRMPAANQPLSAPEYVALLCWIETMGDHPAASDAIDYNACSLANAR